MDIIKFKAELEAALVKELSARACDFALYEMVSFDLGIHPWHGYIEPSFLTTQDKAGSKEIGDWKLYNFMGATSEQSLEGMQHWMQLFWEENPQVHAKTLFMAAAEVVNGSPIREALNAYRKTSTFFVSVYDPDDASFRNYCV